MGVLDQRQTAYAGTDDDANAVCVGLGNFESAVLHGLHARGHSVVDKGVHMTRFLCRNVLVNMKVLHLACEPRAERRCIEACDGRDTGLTGDQGVPRSGNRIADR